MPEPEAPARAFYDHEAEESPAGRRRRPVADWGVGEDAFERLPSRRFSRAEGAHARRAEAAGSGDTVPPRIERAGPVYAADRYAEAAGSGDTVPRRVERAGPGDAADRYAEPPGPGDAVARGAEPADPDDAVARRVEPLPPGDPVARRAEPAAPAAAAVPVTPPRPPAADVPRGRGEDGRRTIVIGEPHDDEGWAPRDRQATAVGGRHAPSRRRRPPRTAVERLGARPDRIVAYAVALGALLILIAILSAGH